MNDDELPDQGPFNKDVIEKKSSSNLQKPLSEQNFIQESPNPAIFPVWLWLFLATAVFALGWGSLNWYETVINKQVSSKPFLEVTNRQFSLFLWQFPSFLRSNMKQKTGYLTGFQYGEKETMLLENTNDFVVAPPDLIFLYHTWSRLLTSDFIARAIPASEFKEFLEQVPEWKPQYWPQAPLEYVNWLKNLSVDPNENLQKLPVALLPLDVRRAFIGWKNYFREETKINEFSPAFKEVQDFLLSYPNYARHNWRNIQEIAGRQILGPNYLKSLTFTTTHPDEPVPVDELAVFLKVALFNAKQAQLEN